MSVENMNDDEKKEAYMEAKILERLNHPNIIRFREVFYSQKPKFCLNIVMDYANGIIEYLYRWGLIFMDQSPKEQILP